MIGYLRRQVADVPAGNAWLTPTEQRWFTDRRSAKRVADWRLGRWTAKAAITAWLDRRGRPPAAELEVLAAEDGAPRIFAAGAPLDLALSLSHSHGLAVAAVTEGGADLGCDLEKVEPRSRAFVTSYFTAREIAALDAVPEAHRDRLANLVWSAKESAFKALRHGLRVDTRSLEVVVSPPTAGGWGGLEITPAGTGGPLAGRWREHHGFVLTVVARPAPVEIVELGRIRG